MNDTLYLHEERVCWLVVRCSSRLLFYCFRTERGIDRLILSLVVYVALLCALKMERENGCYIRCILKMKKYLYTLKTKMEVNE